MADARIFRNLSDIIGRRGATPKHSNFVTVGNVGTGEDDLMTYSLPAGTLNKDGEGVRITAWGNKANNANAKTVKLYAGAQELATLALTAAEAGEWKVVAELIRTAEDVQKFHSVIHDAPTSQQDQADGAGALDDGAAIILKATGTATSDDDIQQEGLIVEVIGA
jgi:hypothetical protein